MYYSVIYTYTGCEFPSKEEADSLLLTVSLEQPKADYFFFKPYENPKDLINAIQAYIERLERDNIEDFFIPKLKGMIKELSVKEHVIFYEYQKITNDFSGEVFVINEPLKKALIQYCLIYPLAQNQDHQNQDRYFLDKNITFTEIEKHID